MVMGMARTEQLRSRTVPEGVRTTLECVRRLLEYLKCFRNAFLEDRHEPFPVKVRDLNSLYYLVSRCHDI